MIKIELKKKMLNDQFYMSDPVNCLVQKELLENQITIIIRNFSCTCYAAIDNIPGYSFKEIYNIINEHTLKYNKEKLYLNFPINLNLKIYDITPWLCLEFVLTVYKHNMINFKEIESYVWKTSGVIYDKAVIKLPQYFVIKGDIEIEFNYAVQFQHIFNMHEVSENIKNCKVINKTFSRLSLNVVNPDMYQNLEYNIKILVKSIH